MNDIKSLVSHILKWPMRLLIKTKVIPAKIDDEIKIAREKPIFYVLKHESLSDLIALQRVCKKNNLPNPFKPVVIEGKQYKRYICLDKLPNLLNHNQQSDANQQVAQLLSQHQENTQLDAQLLPVFMAWGRYPGKASAKADVVFNDQRKPSIYRKFFLVLFSGRHNLMQFSAPLSMRETVDEHGSDDKIAHKLIRVARFHFQRQKLAIAGPKLFERAQLINGLLAAPALKKIIEDEAKVKGISVKEARETARCYLDEMAADYREGMVRFGDKLLTWIWNKLYHGIHVKHAERVRKLAHEGHEIVYLPCHRSHMDYLLLTYVIYHEGLVPPHIAAGINLNFWPVGSFFRRSGAFFMRRSFRGNKLYSAAFREYLAQLLSKGYAMKYYPESGRSRTGRLLKPKTGMVAMTVQSALRGLDRPISLVPVYIGYEHVMEVSTYMRELKGEAKKKESFWHVLGILRKLRHFGQGYVNFGEPINLNQQLNDTVPDWRDDIHPTIPQKPTWFPNFVNEISHQVMCHINKASALNGIALTSLVLLAAPKHSMFKDDLKVQLALLVDLLRENAPFTDLTLPAEGNSTDLLNTAIAMDKFQIEEDGSEIISLDNDEAVLQTYYRNNILHLYMVSSLVAASLIADATNTRSNIMQQINLLLPMLRNEYFLNFDEQQLEQHVEHILTILANKSLLTITGDDIQAVRHADKDYLQLHLLGLYAQETLQRYAIVLSTLNEFKSISRIDLEREAQKHSRQLAKLHGIKGPEFVDKSILSQFVMQMRDQGYMVANELGDLEADESLMPLQNTVYELLDGDILNTIRHSA